MIKLRSVKARVEGRKKTPKLEKTVFLDLLEEFKDYELNYCEENLKAQVDVHLGALIRVGFLLKKNGKYRTTEEGRWASQFLLPINPAIKIHKFFQTQQFYSEDDAYKKLTNLIGDCVHELDDSRYSVDQYNSFIKSLVLRFDIDEASKRVKMKQGDAEGCRRTAAWIAEAVQGYVGINNPILVDVVENIAESITIKERGEIGKKVRRYVKEKSPQYPGIQEVICSVIEQGNIVTYDDIHEVITEQYGKLVDRTTTVRNVLDLGVKGEVISFSRGKGVGRSINHLHKEGTDVPDHLHKNCGSCVFFMPCMKKGEKERKDQRYICELRREYNTYVKTQTLSTYVTEKYGACRYYNSSRKRKSRRFTHFKKKNSTISICQICGSINSVTQPKVYHHYTVCSKCNSIYYYLCDGKFNVKPGVRDLLQEAIEGIFGKSVKLVETWTKKEGFLNRQYVRLTVREGDSVYINQNLLVYVPKEGKTRSYLLDAIKWVRVCEGARLSPNVYDRLEEIIFFAKNTERRYRTPFEEYKDVLDIILSDKLKQIAEIVRGTEDGMKLAWKIVMSKKLSNALLTLQAGRDGLLDQVDAEKLFSKQMDVVAHTVLHWTGDRENLLSYEAHGERIAWQVLKLISKDTSLRCGSRTYERYVASPLFMGEAKARSAYSAGLNALNRHLLHTCREALFDVGFSWYPDELILHFRRGKGQKISIGTVLDFREMFLPLFRYAYTKTCKEGELTEKDFKQSYTPRGEEVYTLKLSGKEKIRELVERLLDQKIYYLGEYMGLREAMNQCASLLCGFLLGETPFIPFICVSDEKSFKEIFDLFKGVERFCSSPKKGPPVPMIAILV